MTIITCPNCLSQYILGVTGTEDGCDMCEGIVRNPRDHSIVNETFDVDECTCANSQCVDLRCSKHGVFSNANQPR